MGPLKDPAFPEAFHFTQMGQIPVDFQSQMLPGLHFLALMLCSGESGVGMRPPHSSWGPLQLIYPFGLSTTTCRCGVSLFHISALLVVSLAFLWFLHYILIYRTSVHMVFTWFSRLIFLN